MKQIRQIVFLIWLLWNAASLAQTPHPLDYFPHHRGDIWEYLYDENPPGGFVIRQNKIISDSLGLDGRYYIKATEFGNFVLDTTALQIYHAFLGSIGLFYKLDADSGEVWTVWQDSTVHRISARVSDVFQEYIFNHLSIVKVIDYYDYSIGAPESLLVWRHYLASNFGLVRTDAEFSAPEYFLRGAIIDNVLYGTVTAIEPKSPSEMPEKIYLYQNYPNPFNPVTTIHYDLPSSDHVELIVYDLLGRLVRRLVDTYQFAGSYAVRFNASDLSSGVYIYQLKTAQRVLRKKMILLR